MRGHVSKQEAMFLMINIEEKVPADHPLRVSHQTLSVGGRATVRLSAACRVAGGAANFAILDPTSRLVALRAAHSWGVARLGC